jgi:uncharacterized protein (DUF433 family)/predicted nuclease of predicted toxin-antitoxin system
MSLSNSVIVKDPEILSGMPVFRGTRVPLQALFDSLEGGETLEEFLEGFPGVSREMAIAALEEAQQLLSSKPWMRILLDECVNQRLRDYLPGHVCQSARYAGFGGLKNGELLDAAQAANFEVLLTVDRGMEYQKGLKRRNIAIVILQAKSIRLNDLISLVPACLDHLKVIQPGQIVRIG